jgi:hypothetical protein
MPFDANRKRGGGGEPLMQETSSKGQERRRKRTHAVQMSSENFALDEKMICGKDDKHVRVGNAALYMIEDVMW